MTESYKKEDKPQLARAEIEEMKQWFSFFDKDGNKKLDRNELRSVFQALCWDVSEAELDQIFDSADSDGSGYVEYEEYLDLLQTFRKDRLVEKKELMQALRMFDKDQSGYVNRKQLMKVLTSRDMTFDDMDKLLDKADTNGDGKINIDEFVELMLEKPNPV